MVRSPIYPSAQAVSFASTAGSPHENRAHLVSIDVQYGQHRAALLRIKVFVRMPSGRGGTGLAFAITNDGDRDEVGRVHDSAVGDTESVAEFATLERTSDIIWCQLAHVIDERKDNSPRGYCLEFRH